jgi:hypothetical protein
MTNRRFRTGALVAVSVLSIYSWNSAGIAQTRGESEKFDASYVDVNSGRTGHIQISVTRWSTPAQRAALQQTLFDKGQNALLNVLRDMPSVGRMSAPGNIGYDLRFAMQRTLPDGAREITLATDRPMSYWEIVNQPVSAQYPFTWLQFRMRPDGKGEGKVAVAARITGEKADALIEVEDFAISPVRLQNITSEKGDN